MNQASKQSNSSSPTSPTLSRSPSSSQSNQNYPHSYLNSNAPTVGYNQPFMPNNFTNYQFPQQPYWNGFPTSHQQQQYPFYPPNYYQNPYNQNLNNCRYPVNNNRYQQNGYNQNNLDGPNMNMNLSQNNNWTPNNSQVKFHLNYRQIICVSQDFFLNKKNKNFGKRHWNKPNNNNKSPNNNNNKQNVKVNKQDLPENNQFNCEVCDRGFKTNQLYEDHCKTHTTVSTNRNKRQKFKLFNSFYSTLRINFSVALMDVHLRQLLSL